MTLIAAIAGPGTVEDLRNAHDAGPAGNVGGQEDMIIEIALDLQRDLSDARFPPMLIAAFLPPALSVPGRKLAACPPSRSMPRNQMILRAF